ncbi:hypothetical protein BD410DRAFT_313952 [Rickenella mellea]|uniref:Uncharacterized protein n=1 Tax=Rickenella mellea TaxID=50990 RepID=A0A4Y7Q1C2_9AGAM|nr:hypothetical protein BD410DRAFT_313952 [Rickenella mellea]
MLSYSSRIMPSLVELKASLAIPSSPSQHALRPTSPPVPYALARFSPLSPSARVHALPEVPSRQQYASAACQWHFPRVQHR